MAKGSILAKHTECHNARCQCDCGHAHHYENSKLKKQYV